MDKSNKSETAAGAGKVGSPGRPPITTSPRRLPRKIYQYFKALALTPGLSAAAIHRDLGERGFPMNASTVRRVVCLMRQRAGIATYIGRLRKHPVSSQDANNSAAVEETVTITVQCAASLAAQVAVAIGRTLGGRSA